jgi:Bacterial Ig-like domain (group 3)
MRAIDSMRFTRSKLGFAVLASAFLAAGVSSVAFGAAHGGTNSSSCYSTCPSMTRLAITGHVTSFGNEQNVVFNVRVKARGRSSSGIPSGTVTIAFHSMVLCTITLDSAGRGSCSPSPTALPARKKSYPVNADYSGSSAFSPSHSGARHVRVLP